MREEPTPPVDFEERFRLHERLLLVSIRRKLGRTLRRRLESGDIVQDVYVEALRLVASEKADREMPDGAFAAWLLRIAEHRVQYLARYHLESGRRSVRREVSLDGRDGVAHSAGGKSPSESLSAAEELRRIESAVERLPPRQREVIRLVHFERLRVSEAASRMGKSVNATSVLLCRALERLRRVLERGTE